jgi:hypothetical protein
MLLWVARQWNSVDMNKRFGGTCSLLFQFRRSMRQVSLKRWHLSTKLHCVTIQKTLIIILSAVKTWTLTTGSGRRVTKITQWVTSNLIMGRITDYVINVCTVGDVITWVGNLTEQKSRVFKEISDVVIFFPVPWWRKIYVIIWLWCTLRDILNTQNLTYWLVD